MNKNKKTFGSPYDYHTQLTDKEARINRIYAYFHSLLFFQSLASILGFHFQSSLQEGQTQTQIVQINSINRGGELGKSGPGPRARADALRSKTAGPNIFVQGFTNHNRYYHYHQHRPLSCRPSVKINAEQFQTNQNGGQASLLMDQKGKQLSTEYKEYQDNYNSPPLSERFDTKNYNETRFQELAKDPKANIEVYHKTSVDEARSALQAEMKGMVENVQRIEKPTCKLVDLDFKVDGPKPFTHIDVKHPVGSEILTKQKQSIDIKTMAFRMGSSIKEQKAKFLGFEQGPTDSQNVLHIVDLAYLSPHEKTIVKEYCIKGAGGWQGIQFLNDNDK